MTTNKEKWHEELYHDALEKFDYTTATKQLFLESAAEQAKTQEKASSSDASSGLLGF